MQSKPTKTIAIILSGGAGSRLSGVDKGLAVFEQKRLVEHVIARVAPQVDDIIICANRNLETYQKFGYQVVSDSGLDSGNIHDYQGPMAGIASSLKFILEQAAYQDHTAAMITPCDAPRVSNTLLHQLNQVMIDNAEWAVSVAHDGQRRQNLHCLIKRQKWQSLVDFYLAGNRAMHRWFDEVGSIDVDFSDQAMSFKNLNKPEDFLGG